MFSSIRSLVGSIRVEEKNGLITMDGFRADGLIKAVGKVWSTSKIMNNMLSKARGSSIEFPSFFAIEMEFILTELSKQNVSSYLPKRVLNSLLVALRENTWIKRIDEPYQSRVNLDRLKNFNITPLPHQRRFIDIYDEKTSRYGLRGYVLGAAPGSGKSLGALFLMETLSVDTIIVVSPNNAVDEVWKDTIGKYYKRPIDQWVSSSKTTPESGLTHYTMHYEYIGKFVEWAKTQRGFGRIGIVLDESHNFNDSGTQFSQRITNFLELCKLPGVEDVLWQSGTPVKAIGNEIIPLLRCIDPLFDTKAETHFRPIFGREAKRAIDILSHRIGLITYKVDSLVEAPKAYTYKAKLANGKEFTLEHISKVMVAFIKERMDYYEARLPEYERRYFELINQVSHRIPKRELDEYLAITKLLHERYDPKVHKEEPKIANRFEERYIIPNLQGKDKADFRDARSVYKYYWLKVQGEALGRILGKERSRCSTELATGPDVYVLDEKGSKEAMSLTDMIDSSDSKTVIFSNYIQTAEAVAKSLRDKGYTPVVVHGSTGESVSEAVQRFERDDTLNPIIATYKSLSTAVPLIMASTTICIDQPFRDGERKQAVARTARLGQVHPVRIMDLYLDTGSLPNISTRTKDIVEWSRQQVELLMGRTVSDTVGLEAYGTPMPPFTALGAGDEFPSGVVNEDVEVSLEALRIPESRSYAYRITNW